MLRAIGGLLGGPPLWSCCRMYHWRLAWLPFHFAFAVSCRWLPSSGHPPKAIQAICKLQLGGETYVVPLHAAQARIQLWLSGETHQLCGTLALVRQRNAFVRPVQIVMMLRTNLGLQSICVE
jgi:hypothetical protein